MQSPSLYPSRWIREIDKYLKPQWHSERCHPWDKLSFFQLAADPSLQDLYPLTDPRHTLTTQPLTSSHPQPAAQTASVFHYSAFQLPSAILQQLLRQHEQGARLRFCLFNIQPGEYHLRRKAWMKRTFLSLLSHKPESMLLKGHLYNHLLLKHLPQSALSNACYRIW